MRARDLSYLLLKHSQFAARLNGLRLRASHPLSPLGRGILHSFSLSSWDYTRRAFYPNQNAQWETGCAPRSPATTLMALETVPNATTGVLKGVHVLHDNGVGGVRNPYCWLRLGSVVRSLEAFLKGACKSSGV